MSNKSSYTMPPGIDLSTRLVLYVTKNMHALLKDDLEAGVVSASDFFKPSKSNGAPPFFLAVQVTPPAIDVLRVLVGQPGVDLDVREKNAGYTALCFAVMQDKREAATVLLEAGASPFVRSKFNQGLLDLAQSCLQDMEDAEGGGPMIAIIKKFIDNNKDAATASSAPAAAAATPNLGTNVPNPNSLAGIAQQARQQEQQRTLVSVALVIQHITRGNIEALEQLSDLVSADFINSTAHSALHDLSLMHFSAQVGNVQSLAWFIRHGGDVNVRQRTGATPLHLAVASGQWAAANFLIAQKSDLSLKAFDGRTAYRMMNTNGNPAFGSEATSGLVLSTLSNGMATSASDIGKLIYMTLDSENVTLLHVLVNCQVVDKQRLEQFIDEQRPLPALHFCARAGKSTMLAFLLRKSLDASQQVDIGLDVNLRDVANATALHAAIRSKQLECMKVLLSAGASIELRDANGETAVDAALASKDVEIVRVMEAAWRGQGGGGSGFSSNSGSNSNFGSSSSSSMGMIQQTSMMLGSGGAILELGADAAALLARFPKNAIFDADDIQLNYTQVLGTGGAGQVVAGMIKATERLVAAKIIKSSSGVAERVAALKEAELGLRLHSPHIVSTLGILLLPSRPGQAPDLVIILQLADGTLNDLLQCPSVRLASGLPPLVVLHLAKGIARGLAALHSKRVLYLDMKPMNILIASAAGANAIQTVAANGAGTNMAMHQLLASTVLLSDFGISRQATLDETSVDVTRAGVGTLRWMSKSQLFNKRCSPRDDIYSCGCVLYWLVSGKEPWQGASIAEITTGNLLEKFEPRLFENSNENSDNSGSSSSAAALSSSPSSLLVGDSSVDNRERWERLCRTTAMCLDPDEAKRPRNGKELLKMLLDEDEDMPLQQSSSMIASSEATGEQNVIDATEHFDAFGGDDDDEDWE